MTEVDAWLLAGLLLALGASFGNWRAWSWLGAAAVSYATSTMYWRTGLPHPAFIGGIMDALICLGIYFFGRFRWEMWVWRLFQFSLLVNLIYLGATFGGTGSQLHNAYAVTLEAVNWLALFWIGGNGLAQAIGAANADPAVHSPGGGLRRLVRALYRQRAHPPFYKARPKWTN